MCILQFLKDNPNKYSSVRSASETETETDLSEIETNAHDTINVRRIVDTFHYERKMIRCCICLKPRFGMASSCAWHLCIAIFYLMWILRKELMHRKLFTQEYILDIILWITCVSRIIISFIGAVIVSKLDSFRFVKKRVRLIRFYTFILILIPISLDVFYGLLMFYYIEILNDVIQLYGILMLCLIMTLDIMISIFGAKFIKEFMSYTYNINVLWR